MIYIVKQNMGRRGWKEVNRFSNAAEADEWLSAWIRVKKMTYYDFTIVAKDCIV